MLDIDIAIPRRALSFVWFHRARRALRTVHCVLMGGHWKVLHTTRERMCLRCVACEHESPGWIAGRPRG